VRLLTGPCDSKSIRKKIIAAIPKSVSVSPEKNLYTHICIYLLTRSEIMDVDILSSALSI